MPAKAAQHSDRFVPFCNIEPRIWTNAVDAPLDRLLRYNCDVSDASPWNALARDPEYGPKSVGEFQDRLLIGVDVVTFETPISDGGPSP